MATVNEHSFLGIIYTFILALIIAVFVGIAINTFYPEPEYSMTEYTEKLERAPQEEISVENDDRYKEYTEERQDWAQNVSIIVITVATFLVALGLFLAGKMPVLPNGILMGGLFTIFYGVGMALSSESRYVIFGVVTVSLGIIATAGYLKFVRS